MSISLTLLDAAPVRPVFAQGPRSLAALKLLRLSVTDRCNLRCLYCMPEQGLTFHQRADLLTASEIIAVAHAAAELGVTHFKITGGEPTLRADLTQIVQGLAALPTAATLDLSLTTNGMLLDRCAADLRSAGLNRLTVSWDSMDPGRFEKIVGAHAGPQALRQLLRGIDAAVAAGFERLKINVVVMAGVNDDEVARFARLTLTRPWTVRFIEYMPLGSSALTHSDPTRFILDNALVRQRIESELGPLRPVPLSDEPGVGPAKVYALPGALGRVGFISAMSQPFCESCNRLRLTAMGELRSCLFEGGEVSVLGAVRPRPDTAAIAQLMRRCLAMKPTVHGTHGNRAMSQMGG